MIRALARLSGTTLFAIFVGIVVIVVVIFLIATGGVDLGSSDDDGGVLGASEQVEDEAADENAEDGPAEDSSGATSSAPQQDEAFDFGDLRIAVTDLRLSTIVSEGRDTVEAIEQFATVLLTVRNTSDAPVSLSSRLLLLDGRGRIFSPDAEATAAVALRDDSRRDGLVVALQPGLETDLVVVFQVPEQAENFRLRLSGGYVDVELDR